MAPVVAAPVVPEAEEWSKEASDVTKGDEYAIVGQELELVQKTKDAVRAGGVNTDEFEDLDFLRFLRARAMSPPKAAKMFLDDVKWRREYLGPGGIPLDILENEMKANKSHLVALPGQQPWVFMVARNHDMTTRDLEVFKKFSVFVLEKAIASFPPGVEQFGAVLDLGDAQYKNLDARGILGIFEVLAAHYPDRMQALLVIHVPYIFWGVWKMVKPLIDNRLKSKIVFVEDNDLSKVMVEKIPAKVLPKVYGGEVELKCLWDVFGTP